MKTAVVVTLIASIPNLTVASLEFGQFGGCLKTQLEQPTIIGIIGRFMNQILGTANENREFHCHFDSTFCLDGEEWLNTDAVAREGLGPCTCDEDYNDNVFSHGCYDMATHTVVCSANANQCPHGSFDMGSRYNSDHSVDDGCGDGDSAYADPDIFTGKTDSCGKQCTCNFQYQSRDTTVIIGTTQYGMCFNNAASSYYCALKEEDCDSSSEVYYNPHSDTMSGTDCNCDDVHLGGCMDGTTFSHCAVAIDNCNAGQTYLAPLKLRETVPGVDCRLCRNTWDEDPSTAPSSSPVAAP